jgi:anti-sigma factor RsiW
VNGCSDVSSSTNSVDSRTLGAYVDHELDDAEAAEIEAALRESPALRREVEKIRWITGLVRRICINRRN